MSSIKEQNKAYFHSQTVYISQTAHDLAMQCIIIKSARLIMRNSLIGQVLGLFSCDHEFKFF